MNESKKKPEYLNTDWFNALYAETEATSITAVALKMGVARPTLSVFINALGPYGNGRASPANMEIRYRKAFEQRMCPHIGSEVGASHCREIALRPAPSHNPLQMMAWQACQSCQHKPAPVQVPAQGTATPKKGKEKIFSTTVRPGHATGGAEAEQEGWDCTGGPMDNPYPVDDQRHDYWELGYKRRREFDIKQKERLRKIVKEDVQQAGIIDTVTLPLPEVGGPQIAEKETT